MGPPGKADVRQRGFEDDSQDFGLTVGRMELIATEMGRLCVGREKIRALALPMLLQVVLDGQLGRNLEFRGREKLEIHVGVGISSCGPEWLRTPVRMETRRGPRAEPLDVT